MNKVLVVFLLVLASLVSFSQLGAAQVPAPFHFSKEAVAKADFARKAFTASRVALPAAGIVDVSTMVWMLNAPRRTQIDPYTGVTWWRDRPYEAGQCSPSMGHTNRGGNVLCWASVYSTWDSISQKLYQHFDQQRGWQHLLRWGVPIANAICTRNAIRGVLSNLHGRENYMRPIVFPANGGRPY